MSGYKLFIGITILLLVTLACGLTDTISTRCTAGGDPGR